MFRPEISKEEIQELPLNSYQGPIELINSRASLDQFLPEILDQEFVGFDTETKPNFKKGNRNPVALMQLSTKDKVYIIRLLKTGITDSILELLESSNLLKIGVGLKDDMRALQHSSSYFEPGGLIHLNEMAKEYGILNESLRKLTAIILGFRISKSFQLSNWEEENLSSGQLTYAATDAWVSREMYLRLNSSEKLID